MTPHELNLHVEAFNDRTVSERNERLTLAYMTAYGDRIKRPPSLDKLLIKQPEAEKKEQSADDMLTMIQRINAQLGGREEGDGE